MLQVRIKGKAHASGCITVPGDKSISHRSLLIGSLACGKTTVNNFSSSADCESTAEVLKTLGIRIHTEKSKTVLESSGLNSFSEPETILNCGNSGTTMRMAAGLLSSCEFQSILDGDLSLRSRPMARVTEPLKLMGAEIITRNRGLAPVCIRGKKLQKFSYTMPVASAQVKSSLLLAALGSSAEITLKEPVFTRDHTERMLKYLGADISYSENIISLKPSVLTAKEIFVPGDISSAAFFMILGSCLHDSELLIQNIGLNQGRTGILEYLRLADAFHEIKDHSEICCEPVGSVHVKSCELRSATLRGSLIPLLIDELPVIAVAATQASGFTEVYDASELRVKETDRIMATVMELRKMGADIYEKEDGFAVRGPCSLKGAECESHNDHRIAMALTVAGLIAEGETVISGAECVNISFPEFFDSIREVCGNDSISFTENP